MYRARNPVEFAAIPPWYVCSNARSGSVVGTMTTPTPHTPGPGGPRPGVPLPGQHLQGADPAGFADPAVVRAQIDELMSELRAGSREAALGGPESAGVGAEITRRARILEQAHDVLVQALTTVDKI